MDVTANLTGTNTFPWMEAVIAFSSAGEMSNINKSVQIGSVETYVASAGCLMVVGLCYQVGTDPGSRTVIDTMANDWTDAIDLYYTDGDGNLWGLQLFWAISNSSGLTTITPSGTYPANYCVVGVTTYYTTSGTFAYDSQASAQADTGVPTCTIDTVSLSPLVCAVFWIPVDADGGPELDYGTDWTGEYADSFTEGITYWCIACEDEVITYSGPPPPAPPVRYKKVPLTPDFATTTFDQANRLALYEICRLCGFDVFADTLGNMAALAAFLVTQFPELAGTKWKPPVTLTLEVWSEAVDASWNILKSPDPTGANSKAFCGRRITISPLVSQEWAGDYEIMEATYTPFQSDASASPQGAGIAQAPDQNAGIITLVLRTYDDRWLSMDTSMTPSYLNMPTGISGDELSYTGM